MTTPIPGRDPVEELAEDFAERYRRGERPSLTEYTNKYPDLAEEIRSLFPALVFVEQFGAVDDPATGPFLTSASETEKIPEQVGDFRILREVGRGGMGIVYEAMQESLGRHVALKVLPRHGLISPQFIERFRREARAAAKLHHTNIVPVFGIGEHEGMPYYAMQFIHGQGLELVLLEVRRLQGNKNDALTAAPGPGRDVGITVAQGLLTGHFQASDDDKADTPHAAISPSARSESVTGAKSSRPRSATLEGTSSSLSGTHRDAAYYRGVARIGLQLADALAYAHHQGVLHRDIKPSNLLLDTQGAIWITDFGLAKDEGSVDLTNPGDIVGTIRYMAPERFQGKSDPRSDIYAAGVTLYELLTLRPAFSGHNKASLIASISNDEPGRPRKLDANIPRDLETIVLKAMAKEPAARYQGADEFAEDLRRFLADRPVHARRISSAERFLRWYRRNLAVGLMATAVAVLLILAALGASLSAIWLKEGRDAALRNLARAETAERSLSGQLVQFLLEEARARRYSKQPGQRFKALEALEKCAEIMRSSGLTERLRDELRNEVIACLALPDLRVDREWPGFTPSTNHILLDGTLERYACRDDRGAIRVLSMAENKEVMRVGNGHASNAFCFSPDGRYLSATFGRELKLKVWQIESNRLVFDGAPYKSVVCADFTSDGKRIVSGRSDGSLLIVDIEAFRSLKRPQAGKEPEGIYQRFISLVPGVRWLPPLGPGCDVLACHPDGQQVALASGNKVQVRDLESGKVTTTLDHPKRVTKLAWHPQGTWLAAASDDQRAVNLWEVASGKPWAVLEGFRNAGLQVAFSSDGELLATSDWSATLRLWSVRTATELFRTSGYMADLRFSRDGRRLAGAYRGYVLQTFELAGGQEYRTLSTNPAQSRKNFNDGTVSPDGRFFAAGMDDGARIWDLETGRELAHLPTLARTPGALFLPSGDLLTGTLNGNGLQRWPIKLDSEKKGVYRVGPPRTLFGNHVERIACSQDGRIAAFNPAGQGAMIVETKVPERVGPEILRHARGVHVAVSASGDWVATGTFGGRGLRIWSASTRKLERELLSEESSIPLFSPDERWLALCKDSECRLFRVGSWEPGPHIRTAPGRCAAFSPDGKALAVPVAPSVIGVFDPETGRFLAQLEDPNQDRPVWFAFTPDGTKLLVTSNDSQSIHVWDLRRIRAKLAEMSLDWDLPAFPPQEEQNEAAPVTLRMELASAKH